MGDTLHPPPLSPSSLTALAGADVGRFSRKGFAVHWRRDSCWDKPHQPPLPTQTPIQHHPAPQRICPWHGAAPGPLLSHRDQAKPALLGCHQPSGTSPFTPGQGPSRPRGTPPAPGQHGAPGGAGSCPHSCPDRWFPTQQQSPALAPPARLMCPWAAGHHRSCPGAGTGHPAPGPAPAWTGALIPKRGEGVEGGKWGRGDSHMAQPGGVQEGVGRDVLQPRPGDGAERREGH